METKERYEAYMQDEEFPEVFRKFTYVNMEELNERQKDNHTKLERKEQSKSATGGGSSTSINSSSKNNEIYERPALSSRQNLSVNKTIRAKIKLNPTSSMSSNSQIIKPVNEINKSGLRESNNIIINNSSNKTQYKERKIIGVSSSVIFDEKMIGGSVRSSSTFNKDPNTAMIQNQNNSIINSNLINNNNNIQTNIVSHQRGNSQTGSRLPEIESKLEKLKKLSSVASSNNIFSSRITPQPKMLSFNVKRESDQGNVLLGGIAKKITPTKILSKGGTTARNYSTINNRDSVSNFQYMTHRDKK